MFYALSKILDLAVEPVAWAIALVLVAIALVRSRPRSARLAAALALASLAAFSAPWTSYRLMDLAERSARNTYDPRATYDVVIVLTGFVDGEPTRSHGQLELNGAAERLLAGWDAARSGHARDVLISGEDDTHLIGAQLVAWGVARDRVFIDDVSRNTRQNAVESRKAVEQHAWRRMLLVTSAFHMQRAVGCFRREGLTPDTLPVDYRGGDARDAPFLPRAEALYRSAVAIREFAGRVVYRLVGYTD